MRFHRQLLKSKLNSFHFFLISAQYTGVDVYDIENYCPPSGSYTYEQEIQRRREMGVFHYQEMHYQFGQLPENPFKELDTKKVSDDEFTKATAVTDLENDDILVEVDLEVIT